MSRLDDTDRSKACAVSLCGVGGQGVVLAGVILGDAAVRAGLWACQSAAYTVAARGGFARSEVLVAGQAQACPLAEQVDLLLALADDAWRVEKERLAAGGLAVLDEAVRPACAAEPPGSDTTILVLPLGQLAKEAGRPRSINVVGLGALAGLTDIVPKEALAAAISANLGDNPGDLVAFELGYAAGRAAATAMPKTTGEQEATS